MRKFLLFFLFINTYQGLCEVNNCFSSSATFSSANVATETQDSESLMIQIEEDCGLMTTYQYDPLTKQCVAILQSRQGRLISRYFYFYNDAGFLEEMIFDDGKSQDSNDLTEVTQRQIIHLHLGHQFPLIGKPLKIKSYSWDPQCPDPHGTLLYDVNLNYNQEGQFLSVVNSGGKMALKAQSSSQEFNDLSIHPFLFCENISLDSEASEDFLKKMYDFVSIGQLWDSMSQAFLSGFNYLQLSADQAKMKWNAELKLPVLIEEIVEKIGKTLLGESTYLLMGPHFEETQVGCYGKHEINDKVRLTFINGILNTRMTILNSLNLISKSHGGSKVYYVFRPTEGWTRDITRAIIIKTTFVMGYRSLHAYLLAQMWHKLIEEMGGVEGGGIIIHYAHSLGGSETDRARELLSPEEQKMIRVVTFGSSTLVRNEGFHSVINVVSVNDGVSSFLLEPFGHFRNYFDPHTNVRFYGSFFGSPVWPTDHCFNGPTYATILHEFGQKFLAEFNLNRSYAVE